MPTNLLTLFQKLAEKSGINIEEAAYVAFLQTPALTTNVPDDLANAINRNLISLDDAKNNHPTIKSHYFAEVMANVDRALVKVYEKLKLDQEVIDELAQETSSTKRIALLGTKLDEVISAREAAAGKTGGNATAEKQALQVQIDNLNTALRVEKEARTAEKTTFESNLTEFKVKSKLSGKVAGLKTIYDTLPSDIRGTTLETILNKELQDTDVKLVLDDNGNLKVQKKDGTNYYDENNRLVSADDFIQRTLAKNKILSQSAPPVPPKGRAGENGHTQPDNVNGGGGQKSTVDHKSLMDESMLVFDNPNPLDVASGVSK